MTGHALRNVRTYPPKRWHIPPKRWELPSEMQIRILRNAGTYSGNYAMSLIAENRKLQRLSSLATRTEREYGVTQTVSLPAIHYSGANS